MSQDVVSDWENREFIETVEVAVRKCVDFLNNFHESAKYRLSVVDARLSTLERKLDFLEASLENCDPSKRQAKPTQFKGSIFDPEIRRKLITSNQQKSKQNQRLFNKTVVAPNKGLINKPIVNNAQTRISPSNNNNKTEQKEQRQPQQQQQPQRQQQQQRRQQQQQQMQRKNKEKQQVQQEKPAPGAVSAPPTNPIKASNPSKPPPNPVAKPPPNPVAKPPPNPIAKPPPNPMVAAPGASKPPPNPVAAAASGLASGPPPIPSKPPAAPGTSAPAPPGAAVVKPPPSPGPGAPPPVPGAAVASKPPPAPTQQSSKPPPSPGPGGGPGGGPGAVPPKPPKQIKQQQQQKQNWPNTSSKEIDIMTLTAGNGAIPGPNSAVEIEYTGHLPSGKQFIKHREVIQLGKKQNIKGLEQAVTTIKVGSIIKLWIPSRLAYGQRGAGNLIPPNADLTFQLSLIRIVKQ